MKSETKILIPARMASTRFPGKPLAPIEGIPMVVYCARNALKTGLDVFVCTDSKEIQSVCELYDVKSIVTPEFNTGTDRIAWASEQIKAKYLINLQGDEPLITKDSINKIVNMLPDLEKTQNLILNGITPVNSEEAFDPNNVKCAVIEENNKVLYFSRKPLLNSEDSNINGSHYFKQLGLYAMSFNTLKRFSALKQSNLEKSEKVELLRWIENGYHIKACIINKESISVDTPQDLVNVIEKISLQNS